MKKFLTVFFVCLGVIFFLILVAIGFVYATDTFGVRSLITTLSRPSTQQADTTSSANKNPLLSTSQEKALETIGVDPAKLPSKITPEMLACFEVKLGSTRTLEIKNGSTPTAADYLKAQTCVQ